MNYGKAIRLVRSARGFTQKELAERAKLVPSYISKVEAGERKPTTETLEKIAKALDTPLYLIILLSSEKREIKGFPKELIDNLGKNLLDIIMDRENQ